MLLACVQPLEIAISESGLLPQLKDILALFVSTLTIKSIQQLKLRTLTNRKFLIQDSIQLQSFLSKSQCAGIKSTSTIGVCTVFDGEHPNFQEWILHYLQLGVAHIAIYDTSITGSIAASNLQSDLQPFLQLGYVTVFPRFRSLNESIDAIQRESFDDCYRNSLKRFTFVAPLDADEFIILKNESCLNTFMEKYEDVGGLRVPWRVISPIEVVRHDPNRSFMSQYHYAFRNGPSTMIKTIGSVKYYDSLGDHHYIFSGMKTQVNSRFVVGDGSLMTVEPTMYDDIEVRHYYGPDWSTFLTEKVCGFGEGRTKHSSARSKILIGLLGPDSVEKIESNGGKVYELDQMFI